MRTANWRMKWRMLINVSSGRSWYFGIPRRSSKVTDWGSSSQPSPAKEMYEKSALLFLFWPFSWGFPMGDFVFHHHLGFPLDDCLGVGRGILPEIGARAWFWRRVWSFWFGLFPLIMWSLGTHFCWKGCANEFEESGILFLESWRSCRLWGIPQACWGARFWEGQIVSFLIGSWYFILPIKGVLRGWLVGLREFSVGDSCRSTWWK